MLTLVTVLHSKALSFWPHLTDICIIKELFQYGKPAREEGQLQGHPHRDMGTHHDLDGDNENQKTEQRNRAPEIGLVRKAKSHWI